MSLCAASALCAEASASGGTSRAEKSAGRTPSFFASCVTKCSLDLWAFGQPSRARNTGSGRDISVSRLSPLTTVAPLRAKETETAA